MFLEKGINVFTWNYRAYGRSKGKPTPENLLKCKHHRQVKPDWILLNEISDPVKLRNYILNAA